MDEAGFLVCGGTGGDLFGASGVGEGVGCARWGGKSWRRRGKKLVKEKKINKDFVGGGWDPETV